MPVDVLAITKERLEDWGAGCVQAHATPVLMLAIGHDNNEGEQHVFVTEDTDPVMLRLFLRMALDQLS